jgi:CheY-like chemotaxis protein
MFSFRLFGSRTKGVKTPAEPRAEETIDTPPANPNGKRVLIIDDDPVFARATSMALRASGFQVATALDGSEAIAAIGDNTPDAVLIDIDFPPDVAYGGMGSWDGFAILDWIRGLPAAVRARFIMVSSSDSPDRRHRAAKLGAVAFLLKPVNPQDLLAALAVGP